VSEPVHIYSPGLWSLRHEVAEMTGLTPHRAYLRGRGRGAVAGWGHKETADRARAAARRSGRPYFAFEDGMLRSLRPGSGEKPLSLIIDRTGIYYDARQASDLETLIENGNWNAAEVSEGVGLMRLIAERRLSKYNTGADRLPDDLPQGKRDFVLIVDQTLGDASISGALADATCFERMFGAAIDENPGATILVKTHPEVIRGGKSGYLLGLAKKHRAHLIATDINPWALFDLAPRVYTVSSHLGFEALMAGCHVVCFGMPWYGGWGLTDDRMARPARRSRRAVLGELAAALYLRYCHFFDAWRRTVVTPAIAIDQLDFLRRHFHANATPVVCYRIPRWKRRAVNAMLDGPAGPPIYASRLDNAVAEARRRRGIIASWGPTAIALRERLGDKGPAVVAIEDGFLRSSGLGAAFVPPQSLVFDRRGIYYDPRNASDLEHQLANCDFDAATLSRAQALRRRLVSERITKYNIREEGTFDGMGDGRERILVPGQVSDDWAVRFNRDGKDGNANFWLLSEVRRLNPNSLVVFKPHPDVERLGRSGGISPEHERKLADRVVRGTSLEALFAWVDRVETLCSTTGFEALLRGLPVVVHGLPFYAGWGLTRDMQTSPRRGRPRTIDELVAAALIFYPRYWDRVSGRACPPEVTLDRLVADRSETEGFARKVHLLAGRAVITWRKFVPPHLPIAREDWP
jgi:capsular polysaccharide export protein